MGKSSSSPPQVDPNQLISSQAQANRISQFTPQGTLQFGTIGNNGQFQPSTGGSAAQVSESPFQERYRQGSEDLALIMQNTAAPRIQNLPLAPINMTQYPGRQFNIDFSRIDPVPTSADFSGDANKVEKATFDRAMGLMNPIFEQQQRRLDTRLVNSGLPIGSEAYSGAMGEFSRNRDEQIQKAAFDAVTAGRAEQSRLYGQAMSSRAAQLQDQLQAGGFTNTARAQQLQEDQALRSTELSELAALLGLQPVQQVQAQNFWAPTPVDVTGPYQMAQNAAMANWQNQQQRNQGMMQGLFQLGGAALGGLVGGPFGAAAGGALGGQLGRGF